MDSSTIRANHDARIFLGDCKPKFSKDYYDFLAHFNITPEQIQAGDIYNIEGLACNPNTKNIIMPQKYLREQGELLLSYIRHPDKRPQDIPSEILEKFLFDAVTKIIAGVGIWSKMTEAMILVTAIREHDINSSIKLISELSPERLFIGESILDTNDKRINMTPLGVISSELNSSKSLNPLSDKSEISRNLKILATALIKKARNQDLIVHDNLCPFINEQIKKEIEERQIARVQEAQIGDVKNGNLELRIAIIQNNVKKALKLVNLYSCEQLFAKDLNQETPLSAAINGDLEKVIVAIAEKGNAENLQPYGDNVVVSNIMLKKQALSDRLKLSRDVINYLLPDSEQYEKPRLLNGPLRCK